MATRSLRNELGRQLPVLFAHIGWAHHYDGSEPIRGNFAWLKENPRENGEASAFLPDSRGFFGCGIGPGGVKHDKIHVGFLARDPADHFLKVVGLYAAATVEANPEDPNWPRARTKNGLLLPLSRRRPIAVWPGGRGIRRWASRDGFGAEHPRLQAVWERFVKDVLSGSDSLLRSTAGDTDLDNIGVEGKLLKRLVAHRQRELKLRRAKIRIALKKNNGRLVCEVPGCGFDFAKRYGQLGVGYAQVHHRRPLVTSGRHGRKVHVSELAIVCANCHAMIHLGGKCRALGGLIPSRKA
jgi:hypothetical protein